MAAPCEEGQLLRLEEWVDIVSMHKAGISIKEIARTLVFDSLNVDHRGALR